MQSKRYEEFIEQSIIDLQKVKVRGCKLIADMHDAENGDLYGVDFYFFGIVDKSSFLIEGIKACIKEKNLIVFGVLLRTQIDNCLRAFAPTLVDDPNGFVMKVLKGEQINRLRDKNGNKMTDKYLREKLSSADNKLDAVYESACEYVHFSKKGILHTLRTNGKPMGVDISIGIVKESDMDVIHEGYLAFLHFTNMLYERLLGSWIRAKRLRQKSKQEKEEKHETKI